MSSSLSILKRLQQACQQSLLSQAITADLLPLFADALQPYVSQYTVKYGTSPDERTLLAMVQNFNQDGPRLQAMLTNAFEPWEQLRQNLVELTRRRANLEPEEQDELVSQTLIRVQRHLPKFLFLSSFDTWVHAIWQNENRRLLSTIIKRRSFETELLVTSKTERTLLSQGSISDQTPSETTESNQRIEDIRQRLERLLSTPDVKILRLHFQGYTLEEIKRALGPGAPSIATIKRRKDRLLKKLRDDPVLRRIAVELGFHLEIED